MAVTISIIALIVSLCALWGAIEKTMDLQKQINELRDAQITKNDLTVFGADIKGVINTSLPKMKNPPPPPHKKRVTENSTTTETRNG